MAENVIAWRIDVLDADKQVAELQKLELQIRETAEEQKKLRKENQQTSAEYQRNANKIKELRSAQTRLRSSMTKTTSFTQRMAGAFKAAALQVGAMFASVSILINIFKGAFNTIKEFESQMAAVKAITGATNEEFEKLKQNAKDLGATTIFTASQIAELQVELSKLGFSTSEILASTDAITQLAAATGEDLAKSATVAASTVRGFGLTADETQRVVDVMARSFTSSALDLDKFSTAMAVVAPVAKNAGVSIEETTAILAKISDAGVDASTAGTSLRNIFLELSKQGITFEDAMSEINSATDKNAVALELFGKRGATVATIIADTGDKIDEMTNSLDNAGGAAEEMANVQLETLESKMKLLGSAWDGLVLSLGEGDGVFGDFAKGAIQKVIDLFDGIREFSEGDWTIKLKVAANSVISSLTLIFKPLVDSLEYFGVEIPRFDTEIKKASASIRKETRAIKENTQAKEENIDKITKTADELEKEAKAGEKAAKAERDFRKKLGLDADEEEDIEIVEIKDKNSEKLDAEMDYLTESWLQELDYEQQRQKGIKERAQWELQQQQALNDAKLAAASKLFGSLAGLAGRNTKLGKALGLAQIGTDTALAISSLVRFSQANPANAVTFGAAGIAQYAAGFAQIIANIGQAKQILSKNTFADGGFTGSGFFKDSTGHRVAGVVHANEYVVPSNVLNTDLGGALVSRLESMRGFADGGFTSTPIRAIPSTSGVYSSSIGGSMGGTQNVRVTVLESDITGTQRNIDIIESESSF